MFNSLKLKGSCQNESPWRNSPCIQRPLNYSSLKGAGPVSLLRSVSLHHLDIYISDEVGFYFILYFTLEAIAQDNVTTDGFKQQLLQFHVEEAWPCERTSQRVRVSWKSPPGRTWHCLLLDRCATSEGGMEMCEWKLKTSKASTAL